MDLGPVGAHAAETVRELREQRRLSYAELSRILERLGRPIPPLGLRRIEAGERRIDVDDLVALALALEVSPLRLLLPIEESSLVSNGDRYSAVRLWDWGIGKWPLSGDEVTFVRDSHPTRWTRMMERRDGGDAMTLKLTTREIQYGVEGEIQGAIQSAGDSHDVKEAD
jgi:transcriptional regulator with XRE-family HTH domain